MATRRLISPDTTSEIPRVPWSDLKESLLDNWGWPEGHWEPEHMAILGPTGSGKTRFAGELLNERVKRTGAHAVMLATKPADKTLRKMGWPIRRTWPPGYGEDHVIYWPPAGRPGEGPGKQRRAIREFLDDLWKPDSNIIVGFDEIAYVEGDLGLQRMINRYWREARALGITILATTQRPRNVSRHMHSEPVWSVAFRPDDEDDASRVAEIIGGRRTYRDVLMQLERYEFLVIHRRNREAYISRVT